MGVWAAFCVLAAAAVFDRVLGTKQTEGSDLVVSLQHNSFVYLLGAIAALLIAASLFEFQRHDLSWVNGQISYAVTCKMSKVRIPEDTSELDDGILLGNTWSIWNRYRFGMTFLASAVVEIGIALCQAVPFTRSSTLVAATCHRAIPWSSGAVASVPLLLAVIICFFISRAMSRKDAERG